MDKTFLNTEKLYRAIFPPEVADIFWKRDGGISSAAFADPKGLSVDRGDGRSDESVIAAMSGRFAGHIASLYVKNCRDIGAVVRYKPTRQNPYHSEIHGSEKCPLLSKTQRRFLACKAEIVTPRPL